MPGGEKIAVVATAGARGVFGVLDGHSNSSARAGFAVRSILHCTPHTLCLRETNRRRCCFLASRRAGIFSPGVSWKAKGALRRPELLARPIVQGEGHNHMVSQASGDRNRRGPGAAAYLGCWQIVTMIARRGGRNNVPNRIGDIEDFLRNPVCVGSRGRRGHGGGGDRHGGGGDIQDFLRNPVCSCRARCVR